MFFTFFVNIVPTIFSFEEFILFAIYNDINMFSFINNFIQWTLFTLPTVLFNSCFLSCLDSLSVFLWLICLFGKSTRSYIFLMWLISKASRMTSNHLLWWTSDGLGMSWPLNYLTSAKISSMRSWVEFLIKLSFFLVSFLSIFLLEFFMFLSLWFHCNRFCGLIESWTNIRVFLRHSWSRKLFLRSRSDRQLFSTFSSSLGSGSRSL